MRSRLAALLAHESYRQRTETETAATRTLAGRGTLASPAEGLWHGCRRSGRLDRGWPTVGKPSRPVCVPSGHLTYLSRPAYVRLKGQTSEGRHHNA